MAYFLGRDVVVAITTEDGTNGVDVTSAGVKGTFTDSAGSTDIVFAGPRNKNNAGSSSVFGTQTASDAANNYSNEISDLTGVDLGIGVTDEDITYMGQKSVLKAEIKKETTVSLTRKKSDLSWDIIFNDSARWGVNGASDFHTGLVDPGQSDFGYRLYIKLKNAQEVFEARLMCITGHSVSLNADGTTEETLEFMTYVDPLIGTVESAAEMTTGF